MRVSDLYPEVAKELGMSEERVRFLYQSYWEFFIDKFKELPLKEGMTQDDFKGLRSGFHMQKIGKFFCDYKTYSKFWKHYNYFKKQKRNVENNKSEADV